MDRLQELIIQFFTDLGTETGHEEREFNHIYVDCCRC